MIVRRVTLLATIAMLGSSCALIGVQTPCGGTEIIGQFEQVGDLVENANVQSSDVVIGTIKKIELNGWNAQVTMCIDEDEKIPDDTRAVVRTTSLLGEKFVDLQMSDHEPPYLEDGAVLDTDQTGKSTELEDVFARLGSILGTGNLEQLNRFTSAQADVLRDHTADVRTLLTSLRDFTDTLAGRKDRLGDALDSLDSVSETVLGNSKVLTRFLESFAGSSRVLADQKEELQTLLSALDRFTDISVQLLNQTEGGLNEQFADLRPVLRTLVANSANLVDSLQTLATFAEYFPESIPGDYIQLDVCQAPPDEFDQGVTCPQSLKNDDPTQPEASNPLQLILNQPLRGSS